MPTPDSEYLFRALKADEEDRLTCEEWQDSLPEYVTAIRNGQQNVAQWQPVTHHMETCPHCSAAYTDLVDLLALAEGETGIQPNTYPTPDLSFLNPMDTSPQLPSQPWFLDALGRVVISFSTELVNSLRMSPQQQATAGAGLKSGGTAPLLQPLIVTDVIDDLGIIITIEQMRHHPEQSIIIVDVQIPSRGGWPNLAGTPVTLQRADQSRQTQRTDAFGKAVFKGLPVDELPELVVEVGGD